MYCFQLMINKKNANETFGFYAKKTPNKSGV
jgi:hypothetical protein